MTGAIPGVPQGMYLNGCRAIGDTFYCEECVRTWAGQHKKNFDEMVSDSAQQFAGWWNRTVERQTEDKSRIRTCMQLPNGSFVEL